ncbi:hypothetical protein C2I18_08270 [Paenibacillus sp. PK3_47]|nr:hypothetical protein C2I18_08270 [Paenibacillus sp. PK3_47]
MFEREHNLGLHREESGRNRLILRGRRKVWGKQTKQENKNIHVYHPAFLDVHPLRSESPAVLIIFSND